MTLFPRSTTPEEAAELETDPRPELSVPPELEPWYTKAYESTKVSYKQLAEDVFLEMNVRRAAQFAVLRARGLTQMPGTVRAPGVSITTSEQQAQMHDEWMRDFQADRALDREIGDDVRAEVEQLASDMLNDPGRLLEWHRHGLALNLAQSMREREEQKAANDRQHAAMYTCPVCGEYKTGNGAVRHRTLVAEPPFIVPDALKLRSCASCHAVAVAERTASLAAEMTAAGASRLELVRDALSR